MKIGRRGWHLKTILSDESWPRVLRRDPCVYCGVYGEGTVEHVDPDGSRDPSVNGVGACYGCNHERGDAPLLAYLLWRTTDRSEQFGKWNWRNFDQAIRQRQTERKLAQRARKEQRVPSMFVTLAELVGYQEAS